MRTEYPRLLVATEFAPNSKGGGGSGALMRQMLKDWPVDRLFWWSCFPDRDQFFGQKTAAHRVASIPQKLYPNRRWRAQKSWLLEKIWTPSAARHFKKTLEIFKPDAIWVHPHSWAIPPLTRALRETKIGFHVSIHDYANVNGNVARFGADYANSMAEMAEQLYSAATTRDAICRAMVDDLRSRTGRDGCINRAGLEKEDFGFLSHPPAVESGPIRIAYAGTILVEKEFELMAKALSRIRHQLPRPLTLDFFGDHSYRTRGWFESTWMKEHGSRPAMELSRALKECTWGFSPMALTDDDPRYNRFSLPTKFVSYLAAGLPVINLGHPESSVVKLASQYRAGLCVTENNWERLCTQLLTVLPEPNPKTKYRAEIQRCALAEFDARQMRATLYENFRKCASVSK
jgi:hypothetical protein